MNRSEIMLKVLKLQLEPIEVNEFYELCNKEYPNPKGQVDPSGILSNGAYSYKRGWYNIKTKATLIKQDDVVLVELKNSDYSKQSHIANDLSKESFQVDLKTPPTQNSAVASVPFLVPKVDNYLPVDPDIEYIEQKHEWKLVNAHLNGAHKKPLLIKGHKGVCKTGIIQKACFEGNIHLIQFDCSENMKRYDLIGRYFLKGKGEGTYILGALALAVEVANTTGQCALSLEEFNALSHNVQISLNQITDFRRQVHIPELSKTFRVKKGCKLTIFATQNPSDYAGVNELNESVRSRFAELEIDYPTKETEIRIVGTKRGSLTDLQISNLCEIAKLSRAAVKGHEYSYAISPRDLISVSELYDCYLKEKGLGFDENLAWQLAIELCLINRYDEPNERATFKKLCERTLDVKFDE